ncbi:MAG: hypothetical protein CM1200mP28_03480 [Deltaproteobacteria bacterium]|nr:MAG: hypothetical protein CM1200mP28_03480 [Deltaproteobacteria bacterium]
MHMQLKSISPFVLLPFKKTGSIIYMINFKEKEKNWENFKGFGHENWSSNYAVLVSKKPFFLKGKMSRKDA